MRVICEMVTSLAGGRCEPIDPELALVESERKSPGVTVMVELDWFCVGATYMPSEDEPLVTAVIQTICLLETDRK